MVEEKVTRPKDSSELSASDKSPTRHKTKWDLGGGQGEGVLLSICHRTRVIARTLTRNLRPEGGKKA